MELETKESRLDWGWCLFLKKEKYPKSPIGGIFKEEHARRIAAAVNAVEGIETEWLEKYRINTKAIDEIYRLRAQNARLLEALKGGLLNYEESTVAHPDGQTWIDWEKQARRNCRIRTIHHLEF